MSTERGWKAADRTAPGGEKVNAAPTVALKSVSKTFGGVHALADASLVIQRGEVHGLLGENGSGKSTLIKILSGYHGPDGGELEVDGEPIRLPLSPGQFRALGFEFVHQDLGLVHTLSVVENLMVSELASPQRPVYISWRAERRRARELFARYGLEIDPHARVAELSPIAQASLAIVRAVEGLQRLRKQSGQAGHGLLVLDEPTVFLPKAGRERLFELIRDIAASSASVLFVSHYLDEVLTVTDRVTVLRDGRVVGSVVTAGVTEADLVEMILGKKLATVKPAGRDSSDRPVLAEVEDVRGTFADGVSFAVREGEVLGLTGLAGSGFEEIPYLLFGAKPAKSGAIVLRGNRHDLVKMTPPKGLKVGLALVPADRQRDASLPSLPITENVAVPALLPRFFKKRLLRRRKLEAAVRELLVRFDVRPPDPRPVYSSLSGGNQQKALLAKWFATSPAMLLLHEPTQGVDVGARGQIFNLAREATNQGVAVVCASTDYEQLETICDRVLIFGRGRVTRELGKTQVHRHVIAESCYDSLGPREEQTLAGARRARSDTASDTD